MLAAAMLLTLAACGEGENAPGGTTTLPSTTLPIPTTSNGHPTQEAEALQIGKELLGKYLWYGALGVCCDTEYVEGDMSAYLSDTQKDLYIGSQHKITCCKKRKRLTAICIVVLRIDSLPLILRICCLAMMRGISTSSFIPPVCPATRITGSSPATTVLS